MKISEWIDAFRSAEGPPPQTLGAFMRWCLSGSWPALWLAAFFSAAAGAMEAGTAYILGLVIDATAAAGPEAFFDGRNLALIAGAVAFFLVARPLLFGLSASANAIIVQPNVNPLVLSRLHRWTLGQTVGFFDDDFAGRMAVWPLFHLCRFCGRRTNHSTDIDIVWRDIGCPSFDFSGPKPH